MGNKTISLSEWVIEKLKQEYNASALIDRLLRNYYEFIDVEKPKLSGISAEEIAKMAELKRRNDEASAKLRAEIEEELERQNKIIDEKIKEGEAEHE